MSYDHGNRMNRIKASSLFRELRASIMDGPGSGGRAVSPTAEEVMPWWRLSKVEGVHVYRSAEGWNADIVFKGLPVGMPEITGNAVPLESRRDALASAVMQLSFCAARERTPLPASAPALRHFAFDRIAVPVDAGMLADYIPRVRRDGLTWEDVASRLAELRHMAVGDGAMTSEAYAAMDRDLRKKIIVNATLALALGMHRFTRDDGLWDPDYVETPGIMH